VSRALTWARALMLIAAGASCDGQPLDPGTDEPVRVRGAEFVEGDLPPASGGPRLTQVVTQNPVVLPGQGDKQFSGRVEGHASSVVVRLVGVGTGFWVIPLGGPDPQFPGELTWSASLDFASLGLEGPRVLRFSAVDSEGRGGPVSDLALCFASRTPDNLHACDPERPLPGMVVELSWDTDMDVDLVVLDPDGREFDAKSSVTPREDGVDPRFQRDSLANCIADGQRHEALIVPAVRHGFWSFHARVHSPCGLAATHFVLKVSRAASDGAQAAPRELVPVLVQKGVLLASDSVTAPPRGTFVGEIEL
jgi:hypothetical protein